ncbi:ABC transporter permease, partial [Treponema sp. R6D11]
KQLPDSLLEAAEDLGASKLYAIKKVILPEIRGGIINGLLLAITLSIDDFVVSFFTKGAGVSTLSVLIYAMARKNINPSINALSTIMFTTVLALLVIVNLRTKDDEILNN